MIKLWRKKYTTKHDAQIEIFFVHVNWYMLLRAWGLFPTNEEAMDTVTELRSKTKVIKKVWHNNPQQTLPQILNLLGLLPLNYIKRGFHNAEWYFSNIEDLMVVMGIPESEHLIWCSQYNIFNIRRKYPKCVLVKDLSTWHIKRILNYKKLFISKRFRVHLENELDKRGTKLFWPYQLYFK